MKRLVFSILTIFVLTLAGAAVAQSPQNTVPPGPTQQQEPGLTNNNLPNPGNPQTQVNAPQPQPLQEQGTTEGTATESINNTQGGQTTGNVTGTMPETETGTGVDVDVDTGANAAGAVDVDVNSTTDADTDASGIDETGSLDNDTNVGADTDTLPDTATNLPLVGLIGLLALGAALAVRRF